MDRLKLIDDVRKKALLLMKDNPSLSYELASKEAKIQITGEDTVITQYHQGIELGNSFLEIAKKELSPNIKIDLYREDQLKEMIVANRLGVNLESFINVFLTPEQIRFLTLNSLKGEDITKDTSNSELTPNEEKNHLVQNDQNQSLAESGYQKKYTMNEYWNVA